MQLVRKTLLPVFAFLLSAPSLLAGVAISHIRVPASAFFPVDSGESYSSLFVGGPRFGGDDGTVLQAPIQLPSGATITSLELEFVDSDSTVSVQGSFLDCDALLQGCTRFPAAGAGPGDCLEPGYICSGHMFHAGAGVQRADLSPDEIIVDNDNRSYSLVAITNRAVGAIAGMRVGYVLTPVSIPNFSTFEDVPKDHPFYKFIEALYASGITAGCSASPARFCPDEPLTRGQMAVFLAVGFGLQ